MERAEAIEGLLQWSERRHPIVPGQRNASLFKLASAFSAYGIPVEQALAACSRFEDTGGPDPFTLGEITATVKSAYKRTAFGTKQWKSRIGPHRRPPPENRVQAFIRKYRLEHAVEALGLDLDRARIIEGGNNTPE